MECIGLCTPAITTRTDLSSLMNTAPALIHQNRSSNANVKTRLAICSGLSENGVRYSKILLLISYFMNKCTPILSFLYIYTRFYLSVLEHAALVECTGKSSAFVSLGL